MADIDGDASKVAWLQTLDSADAESSHNDRLADELPDLGDKLIVGAGGVASFAIATLGVWKLAELIV